MARRKFKYKYYKKYRDVVSEHFTNDLTVANNNSYWAGMPYYELQTGGKEKKIKPQFIMTDNLIDDGHHNRVIRKNRQYEAQKRSA